MLLHETMVRRCKERGGYGGKVFPFGFLEPGANEQTELVFLNDQIEWFEVHWFEGRHVLCVLPPLICRAHERGIPTVPSGYIAAMNQSTKVRGIVRLTTRIIEEEPRLKSAKTLRGVQCAYWREGKSQKGKKHLRVTGDMFNCEGLPAPPDVVFFVLKTFGSNAETK